MESILNNINGYTNAQIKRYVEDEYDSKRGGPSHGLHKKHSILNARSGESKREFTDRVLSELKIIRDSPYKPHENLNNRNNSKSRDLREFNEKVREIEGGLNDGNGIPGKLYDKWEGVMVYAREGLKSGRLTIHKAIKELEDFKTNKNNNNGRSPCIRRAGKWFCSGTRRHGGRRNQTRRK